MGPQEDREMNRGLGSEEMLPGDRMEEIIKETSMVGPGGDEVLLWISNRRSEE